MIVPCSGVEITKADKQAVIDVANSGWFTESYKAKAFIKELREFVGVNHGVLVNSGSSANLLALTAIKEFYKEGTKVITSATAFPTTVAPIIQCGYTPLFVDIDPQTLNAKSYEVIVALHYGIDVAGIMMAHTMGFPFDIIEISEGCKRSGKFLVEDCADALGTVIGIDGKVGAFGDVSTYSFFPAHLITSGEGGAVLCNSGRLYRELQRYSSWGRDCYCLPGDTNTCNKRFDWEWEDLPKHYDHKYTFTRVGYNLHMTEMQAALGWSQIQRIEKTIEKRTVNYHYLLYSMQEYIKHDYFYVPPIHYGITKVVPFGFPIICNPRAIERDDIISFLEANQIRTRPIFAGNITRHPMMKDVKYNILDTLEGSDYIMNNAFWIGCQDALTKEQLDYVIEKFAEYMKGK